MRARAAALVALLLVGGVQLPAGAAPAPRALVVEGRGATSVVVTVREPLRLEPEGARFTGQGAIRGFYAEPLFGTVQRRDAAAVGVVQQQDLRAPGDAAGTVWGLGREWVMAPGRWRVYLLAGPGQRVSVSVPLERGQSLRVATTRPARLDVVGDRDILTGPLTASNRQRLSVRGTRALAMSAVLVGEFRAYAGDVTACVTFREAACGQATSAGIDGTWGSVALSPLAPMAFAFGITYSPGVLRPGGYDAVQGATNAATLQYAAGAAFALALE